MSKFEISSKAGALIGTYDGSTKADAVDAMARDAGYNDASHMDEETGQSWEDELLIDEV